MRFHRMWSESYAPPILIAVRSTFPGCTFWMVGCTFWFGIRTDRKHLQTCKFGTTACNFAAACTSCLRVRKG